MTQTGPDLVGAGYPLSRPLLALLGGAGQSNQSNMPIRSNLEFGVLGQLLDGTAAGGGGVVASPGGAVLSIAVPAVPGDVITKITFLIGGTSTVGTNVTNQIAGLYTGTGSAPGTANVQPTLIATSACQSAVAAASRAAMTFSFATPQVITPAMAPYGFVYAAYSITTGSSTGPSFISGYIASAAAFQWYANGPVVFAGSHNTTVGSALPTTMSNITANPLHVPIVFLS